MAENEKKTLIREERYRIDDINHLCIGDPQYLEHIEEKSASKGEKELCFIKPVNSVKCEVDIKEINTKCNCEGLDLDFTTYEIIIYCADMIISTGDKKKDKQIRKAYKNGELKEQIDTFAGRTIGIMREDKYYAKDGEPKYLDLGCDTASFVLCTNKKKSMKFDTGSDGYYGTVIKHRNNVGLKVELSISADMYRFEELRDKLKYVLDFKEKLKIK